MKPVKKKIVLISTIVLAILFFALLGNEFMGSLVGKWAMSNLNATVQHEYFIDRNYGIQFKVPSAHYVSDLKSAPSNFYRHLYVNPKIGKTTNANLRSIYYKSLPSDLEKPIEKEIEDEIWRQNSLPAFMKFFMSKDFRVETKEIKNDRGILIYSTEVPLMGRIKTKEMYGIKNNFMVTFVFGGKKDYDQEVTQSIFDELMSSFTSNIIQ